MVCLHDSDREVLHYSWPELTARWTGRSRSPSGLFPCTHCPVIFPSPAPSRTSSDCGVTSSACQPSRWTHPLSWVPNSCSAIPSIRLPGDQQSACAGWRWASAAHGPRGLWGEESRLPVLPPVNVQLAQIPFWNHSVSHEHSITCDTRPCFAGQWCCEEHSL